jgi:hypothetical protein
MKRKGLGKGLGQGYRNLVLSDPLVHRLSRLGVKTKPVTFTQRYKRGDGSTSKLKITIERLKPDVVKEIAKRDPKRKGEKYVLDFEGYGFGTHVTVKSPKEALTEVDEFIEDTKGISDKEVARLRGHIVDSHYWQMGQFQRELDKLASDPKNCGGTCIIGQGIEISKNGTTVWRLPYNCFQSDMADSTVKPLMDKIQKFFDKDPQLVGMKVYHNEGVMD